jgi:hypothetical protein
MRPCRSASKAEPGRDRSVPPPAAARSDSKDFWLGSETLAGPNSAFRAAWTTLYKHPKFPRPLFLRRGFSFLSATSGPTRTSGDVRFLAAVEDIADSKRVAGPFCVSGLLVGPVHHALGLLNLIGKPSFPDCDRARQRRARRKSGSIRLPARRKADRRWNGRRAPPRCHGCARSNRVRSG